MPVEPPLAHLLGVPFEEFLPSLLGLGAVLAYLRLVDPVAPVQPRAFVLGALTAQAGALTTRSAK